MRVLLFMEESLYLFSLNLGTPDIIIVQELESSGSIKFRISNVQTNSLRSWWSNIIAAEGRKSYYDIGWGIYLFFRTERMH